MNIWLSVKRFKRKPTCFRRTLPLSGLSVVWNTWAYAEVLAGDANYQWLQKYAAGEESMIGHMEPMFELFQKLLDAGAITEGAFTRGRGNRSKALHSGLTTAVTSETQMAPIYTQKLNSGHQYAMIPFWGGNDPDSDYLSAESTYNIAVNKALEAEGREEAKYDKVMETMAWLGSADGQLAVIGDMGMVACKVKDVPMVSNDFTKDAEATIEKGNLAPDTHYASIADSKAFYETFQQGFWNIAKGTQIPEEVMRDWRRQGAGAAAPRRCGRNAGSGIWHRHKRFFTAGGRIISCRRPAAGGGYRPEHHLGG